MRVSAWRRIKRSTEVVSPCNGDWRRTTRQKNGLNNAEPIGLALISCDFDCREREFVVRKVQRT
jgi:hypothetical protein